MAKQKKKTADELEALRSVVNYDQQTGVFSWKFRVAHNVFAGMEAGTICGQGYKRFMYRKQNYPCHQVAWAFTVGSWPTKGIDHKDGDRSNNRIENLREADQSQNNANRRLSKNNRSGLKGVRQRQQTGRWEATIWIGKSTYLGTFDTPEEAHQAYVVAAQKHFGEYARAA